MPKFRKKPVVIEARQFAGSPINQINVAHWCLGELVFPDVAPSPPEPVLVINTLEGKMTAQPGDWIIRGVNDEFYPCKPDIFEKTYEAVNE